MDRHLIKIVWGAMLAALLVRFALFLLGRPPLDARFALVVALFLVGIGALGYVTVRAALFHRNLRRFAQRLLDGHYETGIEVHPRLHDELAQTEKMLNRLGAQLREYDRLRAREVAFNRQALELVLRATRDPVLLANLGRGVAELNPALIRRLGAGDSKCELEGLSRLKGNADFLALLQRAAEKKVPQEGRATLTVSPAQPGVPVVAVAHPIEDAEEQVRLVLVTLREDDPAGDPVRAL